MAPRATLLRQARQVARTYSFFQMCGAETCRPEWSDRNRPARGEQSAHPVGDQPRALLGQEVAGAGHPLDDHVVGVTLEALEVRASDDRVLLPHDQSRG